MTDARKSGATKPVIRSTRRRKGGKAQPVIVVSGDTRLESGASQPIYVVDAAYVARHGLISGAAQPVQEVTNKSEIGGRAKPVYVVSGSFSGGGGPTPPPAFVGFLDGVSNVEHVYLPGIRGLSAYTGPLVRLRRNSDDAELDFTYDSTTLEYLDTAAITAWLAGSTAFVVTIYDQAPAGDDITQGTGANQPTLILSNAAVNNRPTMRHNDDWLVGAFTTGGALSQPITIYSCAQLDATKINDDLAHILIDGDDATNRILIWKTAATTPDDWAMFAGISVTGSAADGNWNIWALLASGVSSELWQNGISEASGNSGSNGMDGLVLGHGYNFAVFIEWIGDTIGAIIIDGNSSNADKNTIGQKFDAVYGITYTDI